MMTSARGKYAFGFCDRTGFRYSLDQLVAEYLNGVKTGLKVGFDVVDPDHPQNFLGRVRVDDPQSLREPRPESKIEGVDIRFPTFNLETVESIPIPIMNAFAGVVTTSGTTTVQPISVTLPSVSATVSLGTISAQGSIAVNVSLTGVSSTVSLGTISVSAGVTTYAVTVASYYGANKYYIDGVRQATVNLSEGSTYRFDQSDNTNSGHPLRFSTTSNGTHAGGSEYTTGVTTNGVPGNAGAYTQITVAVGAPTLYYYCTQHSGMGGTANTP